MIVLSHYWPHVLLSIVVGLSIVGTVADGRDASRPMDELWELAGSRAPRLARPPYGEGHDDRVDARRASGTYVAFSGVRTRTIGRNAVLVTAHLALARGTPTGTSPDTLRGGWSGVFEPRAGRWGLSHEHESFALPRK